MAQEEKKHESRKVVSGVSFFQQKVGEDAERTPTPSSLIFSDSFENVGSRGERQGADAKRVSTPCDSFEGVESRRGSIPIDPQSFQWLHKSFLQSAHELLIALEIIKPGVESSQLKSHIATLKKTVGDIFAKDIPSVDYQRSLESMKKEDFDESVCNVKQVYNYLKENEEIICKQQEGKIQRDYKLLLMSLKRLLEEIALVPRGIAVEKESSVVKNATSVVEVETTSCCSLQ